MEILNGFKLVRDTYLINEAGEIYTLQNHKLKVRIDNLGYSKVSTVFGNIGIYVFLLEAFVGRDPNPARIHVNHIDGNPRNNSLDNLEWVTPRENNIHSELTRSNNRRPKLYSSINGIPAELFYTLKDAAEKLECTEKEVWQAIKDNKVLKDRTFTYLTIACHIPKNLVPPKKMKNVQEGKAIKIRDILTGKEYFFNSFHKASLHFNTSKHHIWYAIRREDFREKRFFMKRYQVAYQNNDYDPLTPEEIEKALNKGPRPVFAYNFDHKKYFIFENAKIFYKENNFTKNEVMANLAKDKIINKRNWVFLYKNDRNIQKLKEYVESVKT